MNLAELSEVLDEVQTALNGVRMELQAARNNDNDLVAAIQRVRNLEATLAETEQRKQYWFEKCQQLQGVIDRFREESQEVIDR